MKMARLMKKTDNPIPIPKHFESYESVLNLRPERTNISGVPLRSFEQARSFAHSLGFTSSSEWNAYSNDLLTANRAGRKLPMRPDDIPRKPHTPYKEEWKGMADWLGVEKLSEYVVRKTPEMYITRAKALVKDNPYILKDPDEWDCSHTHRIYFQSNVLLQIVTGTSLSHDSLLKRCVKEFKEAGIPVSDKSFMDEVWNPISDMETEITNLLWQVVQNELIGRDFDEKYKGYFLTASEILWFGMAGEGRLMKMINDGLFCYQKKQTPVKSEKNEAELDTLCIRLEDFVRLSISWKNKLDDDRKKEEIASFPADSLQAKIERAVELVILAERTGGKVNMSVTMPVIMPQERGNNASKTPPKAIHETP